MKLFNRNPFVRLTWNCPGELQESLRRRGVTHRVLPLLRAQPLKQLDRHTQQKPKTKHEVAAESLTELVETLAVSERCCYPAVGDVLRPEQPVSLQHPVHHVPLLPCQTGRQSLVQMRGNTM